MWIQIKLLWKILEFYLYIYFKDVWAGSTSTVCFSFVQYCSFISRFMSTVLLFFVFVLVNLVILILSFQEPYVANALLPRMCSKWYFGWVTATLWWIQWYTGSPVKNSNVPFGTFLLVSAAKNLTASSRFSGTLSTITKNGPIATFRPQTRRWKPSKTTSAKIALKSASRIAEPRVWDRTGIPISI